MVKRHNIPFVCLPFSLPPREWIVRVTRIVAYINRCVARRDTRAFEKTNGRLGDGEEPRYVIRSESGAWGSSARVDISRRRSDKFGPDYAAVAFIFIEILHPNDHPYFSIGRDFAPSASSSPIPFLPDKGAWPSIPTQIPWIDNVRADVVEEEEEEEDDHGSRKLG